MTKIFGIFLGLILLPSISFGIGKSECLNVDHSSSFGPVRDQNGHGYCWAFVAAALSEEAFCKSNKKNCGRSVSPLDISRCDWSLLSKQEGGSSSVALKCGIEEGVCLEKHAPYEALRSWGCSLKQLFIFKSHRCDREVLASYYDTYQKAERKCEVDGKVTNSELQNLQKLQSELYQKVRLKLPSSLLKGRSSKEFFEARSRSDFLQRALIGKSCEANRTRVPGEFEPFVQKVSGPSQSPKAQASIITYIRKGLSKGSSVGVSLDLGLTKKSSTLGRLVPLYGKGSYHALVVTGMRWRGGKCEVNLRNSWGAGADFHGWTNLSDLEGSLIDGYYLR